MGGPVPIFKAMIFFLIFAALCWLAIAADIWITETRHRPMAPRRRPQNLTPHQRR
jgi:hypothetical protein